MPIEFKCPQCKTAIEAVEEIAGEKRSCPMCGKTVVVPKLNSDNQSDLKETAKKKHGKEFLL